MWNRPLAIVVRQGEQTRCIPPVLDTTKIGLALMTALGSFLVAFWKMRWASH